MNRQLKSIAGALVVAALVVPAANAKDDPNAFTGLGHEGSGLKVIFAPNPFTGLGHEGSGLKVIFAPNPFTGLGHEGSGLPVKHPPNPATGLGAESSALVAKCESIISRPWAN
jgi:hypothetical protein